jgi:hypothetical protein
MIRLVDFSTAKLDRVAFDVLCGDVTILKDAVPRNLVRRARDSIQAWSLSTPETREHPREAGGGAHLASYLPARSQSRYIFHSHEFDTGAKLPVVQDVMPVYEHLRRIYCGLIGDEIAFGEERDGQSFLPQCIQYPRGGGFFQEHFHALLPQRIGLILSASTYGEDYTVGGGRFRSQDGSWVETEGHHDLGDVTLFRYDLGHDITPVDPHVPLDWTHNSGRWTLVLPLKPVGK